MDHNAYMVMIMSITTIGQQNTVTRGQHSPPRCGADIPSSVPLARCRNPPSVY